MSIILSCPSCNRKLKAKDEQAGRRMKCPACLAVVTVPDIDTQQQDTAQNKSLQQTESISLPGSTPQQFVNNGISEQPVAHSPDDAMSDGELQRKAESGDTDAMYSYAMRLLEISKNNRDEDVFSQAFEWVARAAEKGHAEAQCELASGYRAMNNMETAFIFEEKSATQGFPKAQYNLALCYHDGIGTSVNYEKGFHWYQQAANNGFVDAKHGLGVCYILGHGIPQDFKKAAYWLKQAADEGHANAKTRLGAQYIQGLGVPEDREKGLELVREAAELGDDRAKEVLQEMEDEDKSRMTAVAQPEASQAETSSAKIRYIETTPQYEVYVRVLELLQKNGYTVKNLKQKKNYERTMVGRDAILYGEVFVVADPNFHIGCLGSFFSMLLSSIFSGWLKSRYQLTSHGIMRCSVKIMETEFENRDYGNVITSYWPEDSLVGAVGVADVDYDDAWIHLIKPVINTSPSWKNWLE